MAVQLWGAKPEDAAERHALAHLVRKLKPLDDEFWILANVELPPQTDLIVAKRDGLFIIEVKRCDGARVEGSPNGDWRIVDGHGRVQRVLNRGLSKNPYQQLLAQYHALKDLLNEHRAKLDPHLARDPGGFQDIRKLLVFVPELPDESEIEVGKKLEPPRGDVLGLDELPTYLDAERSPHLKLTDAAIRTLVEDVLRLRAQAVRLTAPVGGEVWSGDRTIRWQTLTPAADVARVRVEIRDAESGKTVATLATIGNPGEWPWRTREVANGHYCVQLSAFDASDELVGEDEGEPFTVRNRGKLVTRRRVVAAAPIAALGLLWWHPWRPRAVSAGDVEANASAYLGRTARVQFRVVSGRATDEVIFLNASSDAYDRDFTATIFPEDLAAFRDAGVDDPVAHYYGKTVEVWGAVEWFHGPEIVLKSPEQIRVVRWWEVW